MELKCHYKSGYDSFVKFCRFSVFRSLNAKFYTALIIFSTIISVCYLVMFGGGALIYTLIVLLVLLEVFMACFYFLFPKLKYAAAHGKYDEPVRNEYTFKDDSMVIETNIGDKYSKTKLKYSNLTAAYEVKDYYYMFADKHGAYIVEKKNITGGTPKELSQALNKCMGKKFIRRCR